MVQKSISGWKDGWYVVPYTVMWRDLDGLGHVNNAVYLTLFELARTHYWIDLRGSSGHGTRAIEFIVARAECNFKLQLSLLEEIELCTRVGEIRNSSFDFVYEIKRSDGEVAATGTVVVVLFDWDKNQKRIISQELKEEIRKFESRDETA